LSLATFVALKDRIFFPSNITTIVFYRQTDTEDERVVEKTLTEKQILASSELLENLLMEGDEVVGIKKCLFFDTSIIV